MIQAPGLGHLREETVGAAVGIIADDRVRSRSTDRAQQGVLSGQPGCECQPAHASFERGQALFERRASRVAAAGVLVAPTQTADAVLGVRRHLVDGRHDRTGLGVWLLTGMDGARLEPSFIP